MSYFNAKICQNRLAYLEPSPVLADGGHLIGKDPRTIPVDILRRLQGPSTPAKAIRAKCLECCCGDASEVRKCVAADCSLWPMRVGTNPFYGHAGRTEPAKLATSTPADTSGGPEVPQPFTDAGEADPDRNAA